LKMVEARAKNDPQDISVQKPLMVNLARCGQYRRAVQVAEAVRKHVPDDEEALFNIACCYALCVPAVAFARTADKLTSDEVQLQKRYAASAIDALRQAISHGYRDLQGLQIDPDLDPIRDQPGFIALVNELKKSSPSEAKRP